MRVEALGNRVLEPSVLLDRLFKEVRCVEDIVPCILPAPPLFPLPWVRVEGEAIDGADEAFVLEIIQCGLAGGERDRMQVSFEEDVTAGVQCIRSASINEVAAQESRGRSISSDSSSSSSSGGTRRSTSRRREE